VHLVGRPVDKEDRVTPCELLSRSVPTASASTEAAHARITEAWQTRLELIQHATERRMLPVLDLNPAIEPAGALTAVVVFRNQAFVPHQECGVGFRQLRNLPPWFATTVKQIASPNPVPPDFVVKNGSNMRSRSSIGIPGPESWTDSNTVE
jgi:hypothetical protein